MLVLLSVYEAAFDLCRCEMDPLWAALVVFGEVSVGLYVLYGVFCSVSVLNSAVLDFNQPGAPASLCSLSRFILRSLRSRAGHLNTDHTDHSHHTDPSAREKHLLVTLINCR